MLLLLCVMCPVLPPTTACTSSLIHQFASALTEATNVLHLEGYRLELARVNVSSISYVPSTDMVGDCAREFVRVLSLIPIYARNRRRGPKRIRYVGKVNKPTRQMS